MEEGEGSRGGEGRGYPGARSYRLHSCDGNRQVSFWGQWKILNDQTSFTQVFFYLCIYAFLCFSLTCVSSLLHNHATSPSTQWRQDPFCFPQNLDFCTGLQMDTCQPVLNSSRKTLQLGSLKLYFVCLVLPINFLGLSIGFIKCCVLYGSYSVYQLWSWIKEHRGHKNCFSYPGQCYGYHPSTVSGFSRQPSKLVSNTQCNMFAWKLYYQKRCLPDLRKLFKMSICYFSKWKKFIIEESKHYINKKEATLHEYLNTENANLNEETSEWYV